MLKQYGADRDSQLRQTYHQPHRHVAIYAHRAGAGLAPENTLPAVKQALRLGVNVIDVDVAMTKDGIVVITHDPILNPVLTRDDQGQWICEEDIRICNLTFEQLQQFDVGRIKPNTAYSAFYPKQVPMDNVRIPSLEQVIELAESMAGPYVHYQIEMKTSPEQPDDTVSPEQLAKGVQSVLASYGLTKRSEVHSFDWRGLLALRELTPCPSLSYLTDQQHFAELLKLNPKAAATMRSHQENMPLLKTIQILGGDTWCPYFLDINQNLVNEAHARELRVVVWTVDDVKDMERMMELGVDGIITNRPDVLRGIFAARGLSLPMSHLSH